MARRWIAAAFLLLITAVTQAQPVTEADRAAFTAGVVKICMIGAKDAIPKRLFQEACECAAKGVLDQTTISSVPDQAAIKAVAARCFADMSEKLANITFAKTQLRHSQIRRQIVWNGARSGEERTTFGLSECSAYDPLRTSPQVATIV
jgi:hypothetical protein